MECKTFEIRDRGTFIAAMAVRLAPGCEADRYLLSRSGYGRDADGQGRYMALWKLDGGRSSITTDVYDWHASIDSNTPTMFVAHKYIKENWSILNSGSVIDAEFIRGESTGPKVSERLV